MTTRLGVCKKRKKITRLCIIQISLIFLACASYTVNIATIPADEIEIYINDEYAASTSQDGKASVEIKEVSFADPQFIEAKRNDYYGYLTLAAKGVADEMHNVHSVTRLTREGNENSYDLIYNIVFIVPDKSENEIAIAGEADELHSEVQKSYKDEAQMTEAELDERFEQCRYIATRDDRKIYKKMSLAEKREFFEQFWERRDTAPDTEINEFKDEYLSLLEFANLNFTVGKKKGWKSDRARILLIYGQPNDVEYYPSSNAEKAHQIWRYDFVKGGVIFVFVDVRRFGDFQLVHSTHRDEIQQRNWRKVHLPIGLTGYQFNQEN